MFTKKVAGIDGRNAETFSFGQLVKDKKKQDKALQASPLIQFRASMQSKEGWLANLHRDLNKSSIKALTTP